jgi:hypothetical protein
MFDQIELTKVQGSIDIVLVGAGVGSVYVLVQLAPLNTACLDIGLALSTLANPDLHWNRPFCVPDDEFEINKIRF